MNILAVDDEKLALSALEASLHSALPEAVVCAFRDSGEALTFAEHTFFEVAFLDIQMRGINGLELAKRLKAIDERTEIVFITGYAEYALDAVQMYVSAYLLKPVNPKKITESMEHLRSHAVKAEMTKRVSVHTFGNFEVYLDGKPVNFQYSKTKELFAYLIDRRGAVCSNNEVMAVLWEDGVKNSYFQNLKSDLMKNLPREIFTMQWGKLGINPDTIACDYYDLLSGKPEALSAYKGEYMTQYSWGEITLGALNL